MSKIDIPAPPKPRTSKLQFQAIPDLPPVIDAPTRNLAQPSTTRSADMNFKVTEEFHRAFKAAAVITGISMKELLEESFRLWIARNQVENVARDVSAGVMQERSRARIKSGRNKPPSRGRNKGAQTALDLQGE